MENIMIRIAVALFAGFSAAFARYFYLRKNKLACVLFGGLCLVAIIAYAYLRVSH